MPEPLAVAVAQPPCVPYDVAANAAAHAAAVRSARARVVVFPELSLTGYQLDAPVVATGDPRLAPVLQHASDTVALGVDAYVGGTVKHDHEAALQQERARRVATDHRIWVAVASFAGATGGGFVRTAGGSAIWAPDGAVTARAGAEPGDLARATLPTRSGGPGTAGTATPATRP